MRYVLSVCRLLAFSKDANVGVRPIAGSDSIWRIVTKAIAIQFEISGGKLLDCNRMALLQNVLVSVWSSLLWPF